MEPWGQVDWLLGQLDSHSPEHRLAFVGCLSAEARCAAAYNHLSDRLDATLLMRIDDRPSEYTTRIQEKIETNRGAFEPSPTAGEVVLDLFANPVSIERLYRERIAGMASGTILILDITCLPKRFFFFLLKLAIKDPDLRGLVVTYAQPQPGGYTFDRLAGDPSEPAALPGFPVLSEEHPERVIVSTGFEPFGLEALLGQLRELGALVTFLLPFPPGQPYSRRIWRSIIDLSAAGAVTPPVRRIHALDAFDCYHTLVSLRDPASSAPPPVLAPYGPKPASLAMCLYAIRHGCGVYYTQPQYYHPDYTLGVGPIWAYSLRLGRRQWPA